MKIDEKALAEYEEICEAATLGPWEHGGGYNNTGCPTLFLKIPGHNGGESVEMMEQDVQFIITSRTMGSALCAALRAERATVVRLRAGLSALRDRFRDEDYRAMCIIDEAMRDAESGRGGGK